VTPFKSEALMRLLIADLVDDGATQQAFASLRTDVADLEAGLHALAESAARLPHRARNLLLVNDFLRRLLELHLELADAVERELGASDA
jgi:hypothetical protein